MSSGLSPSVVAWQENSAQKLCVTWVIPSLHKLRPVIFHKVVIPPSYRSTLVCHRTMTFNYFYLSLNQVA